MDEMSRIMSIPPVEKPLIVAPGAVIGGFVFVCLLTSTGGIKQPVLPGCYRPSATRISPLPYRPTNISATR